MSSTFGGAKIIEGLVTESPQAERSLKTRAKAFTGNQGFTGVAACGRVGEIDGGGRGPPPPTTNSVEHTMRSISISAICVNALALFLRIARRSESRRPWPASYNHQGKWRAEHEKTYTSA